MTWTRRRFLRGAGTLLALPALEATMTSAHAANGPRRLVTFFTPNGIQPAGWYPEDEGPNYRLSYCLRPLAPVREDVLFLTGIHNVTAGGHEQLTRGLMCEQNRQEIYSANAFGKSFDQYIADTIADPTQIHSILCTSETAAACATPFCANLSSTSWTGTNTPASRLVHPRAMFERLFGASDEGGLARLRRISDSRSVIDAVSGDYYDLHRRLGHEDRKRLDAWFTGVREMEIRLDARPPSVGCASPPPLGPALDTDDLVEQMLDLIVLALKCDRTRVINYMLSSAQSYRSFEFLGLNTDNHAASHVAGDEFNTMVHWQVSKYANLIRKLRDETQPDGSSLLDSTFVLYLCGISNSVMHAYDDIPVMIGGGGGGRLRGGHRRLSESTPFANIALGLMQHYGCPETRFGLTGTTPVLPV